MKRRGFFEALVAAPAAMVVPQPAMARPLREAFKPYTLGYIEPVAAVERRVLHVSIDSTRLQSRIDELRALWAKLEAASSVPREMSEWVGG